MAIQQVLQYNKYCNTASIEALEQAMLHSNVHSNVHSSVAGSELTLFFLAESRCANSTNFLSWSSTLASAILCFLCCAFNLRFSLNFSSLSESELFAALTRDFSDL